MRNPARIKKILKKIKIVWEENPDLRLCQLLANVASNQGWKSWPDLFYFEDDYLEEGLTKMRYEHQKKDSAAYWGKWLAKNPQFIARLEEMAKEYLSKNEKHD